MDELLIAVGTLVPLGLLVGGDVVAQCLVGSDDFGTDVAGEGATR